MKYGIDTLHVKLNENDREAIEELLFGEPLEVITDSGLECPMEEDEARKEFKTRIATVRHCEDNNNHRKNLLQAATIASAITLVIIFLQNTSSFP